MTTSREIRLAEYPDGWPTESTFELAERELPAPAEGEFLVRNLYMSVDPYMRGRMRNVESYTPPFQIGEPLDGGSVGQTWSPVRRFTLTAGRPEVSSPRNGEAKAK